MEALGLPSHHAFASKVGCGTPGCQKILYMDYTGVSSTGVLSAK
jgi:hypothetical protein